MILSIESEVKKPVELGLCQS